MIDLNLFARVAEEIREKAAKEGRLIENPSERVLRELTEKEPEVRKTIYGNLVVESEPTSSWQR